MCVKMGGMDRVHGPACPHLLNGLVRRHRGQCGRQLAHGHLAVLAHGHGRVLLRHVFAFFHLFAGLLFGLQLGVHCGGLGHVDDVSIYRIYR